jgi:hypothetical protein
MNVIAERVFQYVIDSTGTLSVLNLPRLQSHY